MIGETAYLYNLLRLLENDDFLVRKNAVNIIDPELVRDRDIEIVRSALQSLIGIEPNPRTIGDAQSQLGRLGIDLCGIGA